MSRLKWDVCVGWRVPVTVTRHTFPVLALKWSAKDVDPTKQRFQHPFYKNFIRTLHIFVLMQTKWSNFHDTLSTYIAAYDDELDTQKKRVFFPISFLRNEDGLDCLAADWVRNWEMPRTSGAPSGRI
ncbi:hypothetical protein B0H11DRAFT_1903796 [Mycena galericulata]|nr:hypothetical protein B0H11DRAFT_1903796 [Mycena galericulata]